MKKLVNITIAMVLITTSWSYGQNQLRENLFGDYEKLLDQLQAENAAVLSPENYKKALKYYKQADEDYKDEDESLIAIKKNLQKSQEYANKALQIVALAKDTLAKAISARELAIQENAPIFAEKEWQKAEDVFLDATENLEDDDLDDAVSSGARAYDLFRRAQIRAIRNGILGDARSQLIVAEEQDAEQFCLRTFRSAQNLLAEAEAVLDDDPFNKEEATRRALMASYQARHATYLARTIKNMSEKEENWELLILQFEEILSSLGTQFHYEPKFDQGFDASLKALKSYIANLKDEHKRLLAENSDLEEQLNRLRESEASTSAALKKKEMREQKIEKIRNIFSEKEAQVIHQGDKLIIRLTGLQFQAGRAIIQPEYFSLLTKVQRAIMVTPDSYIVVEGHTDATGNSSNNKNLSEQRARAVTEYLIANLELDPEQIDYYGMGEQKPIASNKTQQGRMQNRRIDIILTLNDS